MQSEQDYQEAEKQLDKDAKLQAVSGFGVLFLFLLGCVSFAYGAMWVSQLIGLEVRVYMDGTLEDGEQK